MNPEASREMKIAADVMAARDHVMDPATDTHRRVAAQIWRTFKALGMRGGHVLTSGDGCGSLMGPPTGFPQRESSVVAHVNEHDFAFGRIGSLNEWDGSEEFDATVVALRGFDVRLTYGPNVVRRRADQLTDAAFALAVTKPGGLTAVLATHDLMDSPAHLGRRDLAGLADLVGAVRFPAGIYRPATGTDEVVDLLVFRRRESGAPRAGAEFENTVETKLDGGSVHINTYFDSNIDQVLGTTQFDPTGNPPTSLTVTGNRTLFPGLLTSALNGVIAYGQRTGLTVGAHEQGPRVAGPSSPDRPPARDRRSGIDTP